MVRALVVRGLVAGVIAGLLAGAFAFAVGEPRIDAAIAIEEAHAPAAAAAGGHVHDEPIVSRDGQHAGLILATTLYGVGLGGAFALAFAVARRRVGADDDRRLVAQLGAALFAVIVLLPFLKYPANPPAVGDPETITRRTLLYLALLGCGLAALLAGVRAARVRGTAAGAAVAAATATLAAVLLPGVDEVPRGFPATLLWEFRITSLGVQAVLWGALAALFAVGVRRMEPAR